MIKLTDILNEILLTEAIPLSKAKEYTSIKRNPSIQKLLDNIFNKLSNLPNAKQSRRKDRVYIPFKNSNQESSIEKEIENSLGNTGYSLKNYQKGIATDKYGRDIKLGRVLTKLKKHDLLNKFNTDKSREGSNITSSYLAFSKHPYDIAGSSTDRGWTSCMNIYSGSNSRYIQHDVKEGTIVCYLVTLNDLNITKPIARILIKPYINSKNMKDVLYVPENVYGTAPPQFKSQVSSIIDSVQGTKVGTFKLHGQLYCDYEREITIHKKEIKDILDGKKKASTKSLVEEILNILGIENYTIKDDLSVDVNGDVNISNKSLKQIPVQFGNVTGSFWCERNNLTSLKGAPQSVGGDFACDNNSLKSLEGAPQSVGGNFGCSGNSLTSLKGAPQTLKDGNFYCISNSLTSLKGAPQSVGGGFYCQGNSLTSLKGAPQSVGGDFSCNDNSLTSLEGAPQTLKDGGFYCDNNSLKSLKGAPQTVGGNFYCGLNPIKFSEDDVRSVSSVKGKIWT